MPRMNNMTKNRVDQSHGKGIRDIASGYAMKARPVPLCTTVSIGASSCFDMNPRTEKTAVPPNMDMIPSATVMIRASRKQLCLIGLNELRDIRPPNAMARE